MTPCEWITVFSSVGCALIGFSVGLFLGTRRAAELRRRLRAERAAAYRDVRRLLEESKSIRRECFGDGD